MRVQDLAGTRPDLLDRARSGRYRARPSLLLVHPEGDMQLRLLGIATLPDKILGPDPCW